MTVLKRDAGPSGWLEVNESRHEIGGWELFEGDRTSPHQGRGWFKFTVDAVTLADNTPLQLHLQREDGTERQLPVRMNGTYCPALGWEFRAEPRAARSGAPHS